MFTNSVNDFRSSDAQQGGARKVCSSALRALKGRVFDIGAAAFSGIGNWPFYAVAKSFGDRYSSAFGSFLGGCEFASYFAFRISNFQEIRQKFTGNLNGDLAAVLPLPGPEASEMEDVSLLELDEMHSSVHVPRSPVPTKDWKDIAQKIASAGLGIAAQFPIMVLVYYANGENLFYPLITGTCEASFTILSLLLSCRSAQSSREEIDAGLAKKRNALIEYIDRFIEELPSRYHDAGFVREMEAIFADDPLKSNEQRGRELLDCILRARGLPELDKGRYDEVLKKVATGVGTLIAAYLTTVNGAVSYKGVLAWRSDQEVLAVLATAFVGLANIKLLGKFCIDSARSYYEGLRDVAKGQYRRPLAASIAPRQWLVGRVVSTALSWFSFGTTAVSARDYVPKAGDTLVSLAPVSSALLLNDSLNGSSDKIVLWANSRDAKVKRFMHLDKTLRAVKEMLQSADSGALERYLRLVPELAAPMPRPRVAPGDRTPLLLESSMDVS